MSFTLSTTEVEFCMDISTLEDELEEGVENIDLFLIRTGFNSFPVNIEGGRLIVFILDNDGNFLKLF